jgi:hypothetical protein
METINTVIERVKRLTPNTVDERDQAKWVISLDNRVYNDVTGEAFPENIPVKSWPEDGDKPLLAETPYDNIYVLYLAAMVYFSLGEYDDYNNVVEQFDQAFKEFRAKWRQDHRPPPTALVV